MRNLVALSVVVASGILVLGCGSSGSTPDDTTMRKIMSGPPKPPMAYRQQGQVPAGAAIAASPKAHMNRGQAAGGQ